jgi:hypothetical protein
MFSGVYAGKGWRGSGSIGSDLLSSKYPKIGRLNGIPDYTVYTPQKHS